MGFDVVDLVQKGMKNDDAGNVDPARNWMCQTFFDGWMFGAATATAVNAGQVRRMFELDRSAARGLMTAQGIWVFEHENPLRKAAACRLFHRVQIARKDTTRPARTFADYVVSVDLVGLPYGIRCEALI